MSMYIQLENNVPLHHPILEENLLQIFPNTDLENLPSTVAPFEKTPIPQLSAYEKLTYTSYELANGVVREIHHTEFMSDEEKTEFQNKIKQNWQEHNGFASWTFDPITAEFIPPIPKPQDGKKYTWDEPTTNWLLVE